MKNISFILLAIFITLTGCMTTGDVITEPLVFSEIIEAPGFTQVELYSKANMWLVDAFNNAKSVIQFSDKETGVIKGKYVSRLEPDGTYIYEYRTTITIETRDGKCKITFSDAYYELVATVFGENGNPNISGRVETVDMANKIKTRWIFLTEDLKINILSNATSW